MSSSKKFGMQKSRKPGNKKRSSSFNFFRKSNISGVGLNTEFKEQQVHRPDSRLASLKSNNDDLAKALEQSNVREADLKGQIAQLQSDNLNLIRKLQCLAENEEQSQLQTCHHKRLFLKKLLEAVEVLGKVNICNGADTWAKPAQDEFVTSRKKQPDCNDAMERNFSISSIGTEAQNLSTMEENINCGNVTDYNTHGLRSMDKSRDILEAETTQLTNGNQDLPSMSTGVTEFVTKNSVLSMSEQRPRLLSSSAEQSSIGSLTTHLDIDMSEAEGKVLESERGCAMDEQKSLVLSNVGSDFERRLDIIDIDITEDYPVRENRARTFVVLDESQQDQDERVELPSNNEEKQANDSVIHIEPAVGGDERPLMGKKRDLKRRLRRNGRGKRKMERNGTRTCDRVSIEHLESRDQRERLFVSTEDKENVNPRHYDSRSLRLSGVDRMRSQGGRCSPMASVVKRLLAPMHTRSPLMRRQPRLKRQVSYAEPRLNKKLRRGDPCADASIYNSPHFGSKLRSLGPKLKRPPLTDLGGIISEENC